MPSISELKRIAERQKNPEALSAKAQEFLREFNSISTQSNGEHLTEEEIRTLTSLLDNDLTPFAEPNRNTLLFIMLVFTIFEDEVRANQATDKLIELNKKLIANNVREPSVSYSAGVNVKQPAILKTIAKNAESGDQLAGAAALSHPVVYRSPFLRQLNVQVATPDAQSVRDLRVYIPPPSPRPPLL